MGGGVGVPGYRPSRSIQAGQGAHLRSDADAACVQGRHGELEAHARGAQHVCLGHLLGQIGA